VCTSHEKRKSKLLACAGVRLAWALLTDERSRRVVDVAELYADGAVGVNEFKAARGAALAAVGVKHNTNKNWYRTAADAAYMLTNTRSERFPLGIAVGIFLKAWGATQQVTGHQFEHTLLCSLIRDVIGNPFRPVALDPAWRTEAVVALAAGIYADRAFERLPVLADALDDTGCDHADILNHCRGGGPHVRGCWVVDLLLGKT
jgi:hypothetical protein